MGLNVNDLPVEIQEKLALRARAKTDKLFLATEILGYDFQPDVHQELFDQYIPFDDSKPWADQSPLKNRLILWSRGMYKSTSIVVEVIQAILNYPNIRILIMQGSIKTTKGLLREIASHFTGMAPNSRLTELFPEFCGTKKELGLTAEYFTTPARINKKLQQATVSCASPKAIKTGQHYDVGFFDDLINDQNYRSATMLKKAEDDFNMCQPLIDPGGYRYVTGTRYAFGDLYEVIIRKNKKEWGVSVKTCWAEDGVTPRFTQRKARDGRVIGFTREMLLQFQADDPAMFSSQYLNKPAAESRGFFTEPFLNAACIAPDRLPSLSSAVLFVDCASSDHAWSDDSVIIAGKMDNQSRVYVVDVDGGTWLPDEFAQHIILMTLKHRPLKVIIEKSASGVYLESMLRVIATHMNVVLPLEMVPCSNVQGAKAMRISAVQGYIQNKRLFFATGLPRWDKIVDQFKKFTGVKANRHDDYCDTIGIMCQEFAKKMLSSGFRKPVLSPMAWMLQQQGTTPTILDAPRERVDDGAGSDFAC